MTPLHLVTPDAAHARAARYRDDAAQRYAEEMRAARSAPTAFLAGIHCGCAGAHLDQIRRWLSSEERRRLVQWRGADVVDLAAQWEAR